LTAVVGAIDELDIVLIKAERTAQNHVITERVASELQQAWKRPANSHHDVLQTNEDVDAAPATTMTCRRLRHSVQCTLAHCTAHS